MRFSEHSPEKTSNSNNIMDPSCKRENFGNIYFDIRFLSEILPHHSLSIYFDPTNIIENKKYRGFSMFYRMLDTTGL